MDFFQLDSSQFDIVIKSKKQTNGSSGNIPPTELTTIDDHNNTPPPRLTTIMDSYSRYIVGCYLSVDNEPDGEKYQIEIR
jgi:hypothetical protein